MTSDSHHPDSMDDDDDDDDHHDEVVNDDDRLPGETEDQIKRRKRKERLEQNRISARESRKRKKTMIEELQRTVITLSRENKDLNERNEQLRRNLMEIGTKVRFVIGYPPPPIVITFPPSICWTNWFCRFSFVNTVLLLQPSTWKM